jgi:hypothetical protein
MTIARRTWTARTLLVAAGVLLAAAAALVLESPVSAQTPPTGAMSLSASGDGVECSGGSCDVPLGGDFTLEVVASDPPADGYVGMQTQVNFAGLTYNPTDDPADEIPWPDNILPLRDPAQATGAETQVVHGGVSNLTPPYTPSTYDGVIVALSLTCTDAFATFTPALLPYAKAQPAASAYTAFVSDEELVTVPTSDTLTINCGEAPTTEPPDGDETPGPDDDETPTAAPEALPGTGSAGTGSGTDAALWLLIAGIAGAGALSLGALAWQRSRTR